MTRLKDAVTTLTRLMYRMRNFRTAIQTVLE